MGEEMRHEHFVRAVEEALDSIPQEFRTGVRTDTLGASVWNKYESNTAVTQNTITISPGSRFRAAMTLAVIADALQIVVFPLFVEGALSPADDVLDFGVAALLINLLGWHWEFCHRFLPSSCQASI